MINPENRLPSEDEKLHGPEVVEIPDNQVIEALRKGLDTPESKQLIEFWQLRKEHALKALDVLQPKEKKLDIREIKIEYEVRYSLLFEKAGYLDIAFENLEANLEDARQIYFSAPEGSEDARVFSKLYFDIEDLINNLSQK